MKYSLVIALALSTMGGAASLADSDPLISEKLLSPLGQGFSYVPSPGPVDLVTVGPAGSRMAVYRNGEPGPRFDEIIATQPTPEGGGGIAVIFSADGSRLAYVGRTRDTFTLMVDGEEVLTGKYDGGGNTIAGVGFNADNHLFYRIRQQDEDRSAPWRFVIDGASSPPMASDFQVMLSPVGTGYIMVGTLMDPREQALIRDGEVVDSKAMKFFYRHDGKLFTVEQDAETNESVVKLEGEEVFRGDYMNQEIIPAPAGESWAMIGTSRSKGPNFRLVLNGEEIDGQVPNMVGSQRIWFSEDGAHWATIMQPQTGRQYLVVDGEEQDEYATIQAFRFSPDGSRHAYWGRSPTGWYFVLDGEEQDAVSTGPMPVVWSADGAHIGWVESSPARYSVRFDETRYVGDIHLGNTAATLGLSPDGSRLAVMHGPALVELTSAGATKYEGLQVVGRTRAATAHGGYLPMPNGFVFSPDSRFLVTWGTNTRTGEKAVFFNGQPAFAAPGIGVLRIGFSPDSRHFYLLMADTGAERTLYVDGQPLVRFGVQPFEQEESMWHIDEDGLLHFMVVDNEGIKRLTVTPSPDRSVENLPVQ